MDSGYIWNVLPTGFADVLVVSGRERGVEAILRPFRRYSLDSLFPRGLGLKKKKERKSKTDSRSKVPISQVIGVKVWEMKNQQAEYRELALVEKRCPEERIFSI